MSKIFELIDKDFEGLVSLMDILRYELSTNC